MYTAKIRQAICPVREPNETAWNGKIHKPKLNMLNNMTKDEANGMLAFNHCVLPVLSYGAETLTVTKVSVKTLQVTLSRMDRSMLGVFLSDRILNVAITRSTVVEDIIVPYCMAKIEASGARGQDEGWQMDWS